MLQDVSCLGMDCTVRSNASWVVEVFTYAQKCQLWHLRLYLVKTKMNPVIKWYPPCGEEPEPSYSKSNMESEGIGSIPTMGIILSKEFNLFSKSKNKSATIGISMRMWKTLVVTLEPLSLWTEWQTLPSAITRNIQTVWPNCSIWRFTFNFWAWWTLGLNFYCANCVPHNCQCVLLHHNIFCVWDKDYSLATGCYIIDFKNVLVVELLSI